MTAGRRGKTSIMGQESAIEHFGQSDIHRIVGGEIVSQSPYPRQQKLVRVS